jgi:hypothetical protein
MNIAEAFPKLSIGRQERSSLRQFDAVIGNPPYQAPGSANTGNTIWQKFVKKSLDDWINDDGYLCFVHPPGWRKPSTVRGKFYGLFDLLTRENTMIHLSIHGFKDAKRVFNAGTKYDWYVLQKTKHVDGVLATVCDEQGKITEIDLSSFDWLPGYNMVALIRLVDDSDNAERCPVMYSASAYETRKKHMSNVETETHKYKCVHTTPKKGTRYIYSDRNDLGFFGVSKVIFGDSGIYEVIVDMDGNYGMSEHAMAIQVDSVEEANSIKTVLLGERFHEFTKTTTFSNFQLDWRLFKMFRRDFWREFIPAE